MCFSKLRISRDSFTIIRPILSHLTSPTNNDIQVTQQKKMLHLPRSALYVIYIFFSQQDLSIQDLVDLIPNNSGTRLNSHLNCQTCTTRCTVGQQLGHQYPILVLMRHFLSYESKTVVSDVGHMSGWLLIVTQQSLTDCHSD